MFSRKLCAAVLLSLFASQAEAGTNEGFEARLPGAGRIVDPDVGQTFDIVVRVLNTTQAKGALVTAKYDADFVSFVSFTPAPNGLITGLLSLPGTPQEGADGLTTIQGGGTQLAARPDLATD